MLAQSSLECVQVDARGLSSLDSAGAAVLSLAAERFRQRGVYFAVAGLPENLRRTLSILPEYAPTQGKPGPEPGTLESMGSVLTDGWQATNDFFEVAADAATALGRMVRGHFPPRGSVATQAVRVGVDAVPIVALLSLLLGLVLAFQSADQLQAFGAAIYTADLVGIGMFREFGPLLTAIVLSGRSGSAMAAELGTMQVNEEIDALHTMGIDPNRFLVLPRLLAIVAVQPVLTLIASLIGTFGGVLIGVFYLKITLRGYLVQTFNALSLYDFVQGLSKSVVFAVLIGLIACYSGMSVSGGATGVGRATTRAVVASIFMIIVADSVFTTFSTLLR